MDLEKKRAWDREYGRRNRTRLLKYKAWYYVQNRERLIKKQRAYYLNNKLKCLEQARKWVANNREKSRQIKRLWEARNKNKVKATKRKIYKRYLTDKFHWKRIQATRFVNMCVKRGVIKKPAVCSKCKGNNGRIEAHHHMGYTRACWLKVKWLCRPCHERVHHPA